MHLPESSYPGWSAGVRGGPRGSAGIRGGPRGSAGVRGGPRGSAGVRRGPRGSAGEARVEKPLAPLCLGDARKFSPARKFSRRRTYARPPSTHVNTRAPPPPCDAARCARASADRRAHTARPPAPGSGAC
eukprot:3551696-Prymnesium_polylepis.1